MAEAKNFWKGIDRGLCPTRPGRESPIRPAWFADRAIAEIYAKPTLCKYHLDEKKAHLELFNISRLKSFCPSCEFGDWIQFAYGLDPLTDTPITTDQQLVLAQKLGLSLDPLRLKELESSPKEFGLGRVSVTEIDQKIFDRLCRETKQDGWVIPTQPSIYHGGGFHPETVICNMDKMRFMGATRLPEKPFLVTLIWAQRESKHLKKQAVLIRSSLDIRAIMTKMSIPIKTVPTVENRVLTKDSYLQNKDEIIFYPQPQLADDAFSSENSLFLACDKIVRISFSFGTKVFWTAYFWDLVTGQQMRSQVLRRFQDESVLAALSQVYGPDLPLLSLQLRYKSIILKDGFLFPRQIKIPRSRKFHVYVEAVGSEPALSQSSSLSSSKKRKFS